MCAVIRLGSTHHMLGSTHHVVPQGYCHLLVSLGAEVEAVRSKVGVIWLAILMIACSN